MKRCLIVDDSDVIRKVARQILEGMTYRVQEAENTTAALDYCRSSEPPDLILLDWLLPGPPALDFLMTLRKTVSGRRPFVIYCTTENDPSDIARAYAAGADDYFLKPFDSAGLINKIADINLAA
ncbi:MAG: response regulator [Hyphomicrobium sp.]